MRNTCLLASVRPMLSSSGQSRGMSRQTACERSYRRGRKPMKNCMSLLCVLGCTLSFVLAANAADDRRPLTFTFKTANVPGAIQTIPGGINNAGVMVGQYEDKGGVFHGYILNGATLTTVDDPKGTSTSVNGIQYKGMSVVGSYISTSRGASVGFTYQGGVFTDVPGPQGAIASSAFGINDSGVIVGSYTNASMVTQGFVLEGTTYTILDAPSSSATSVNGVNDSGIGVVNGLYDDSDIPGPYWWAGDHHFTWIMVPDSPDGSEALGVNNSSDAVFAWFNATNLSGGALLQNGTYTKFNYPGATQTYGAGINDENVIVGAYQLTSGGAFSGFTATF
jgi:hypothetical protein